MSFLDLFQPSCLFVDVIVADFDVVDFFDAESFDQAQSMVFEELVAYIVAVGVAAVAPMTIDLQMSVWVAVDSLVERQEVALDDIAAAAVVVLAVIVYVMVANCEYLIAVVDVVAVD